MTVAFLIGRMQRISILLVIIGAFSPFSIRADEYVESKSPDGKTKKNLHRVTWNGQKFIEEKQ